MVVVVYYRDEYGKGKEIYCLYIIIFCIFVLYKYNYNFIKRNEVVIMNSVV